MLNVVGLVGLALAYLSPITKPSDIPYLLFFGTAYPWFLLLNILFSIIWLLKRSWAALLSISLLLFGYKHITSFIGLNLTSKNNANKEKAIQITTFNVGGMFDLNQSKKENEEAFIKNFKNILEKYDSDVFCLQEVFYAGKESLLNLSPKYPHLITKGSLVVLSKHPILNKKNLAFTKDGNGAIYADIYIKEETIRIYCVHLHSNKVTAETEQIIHEEELIEENNIRRAKKVLERVYNATRIRAEHATELAEHANKSPYKFVICGDFNDTPQSYTYATIANGLHDTFREGGFGLGTTFGGSIPALRIDYILTSRHFSTISCHIEKVNLSDHYPVTSKILLD